MKTKLKVTTALLTSLFLVSIIAVSTPAIAVKPDGRLMINIMAKGDDMDVGLDLGIYRATTLIVGEIRFDKDSGVLQGRVEFHMKIYEISSGEKVYAIKGKLKESMMVLPGQKFDCTVRGVMWTNLWLVVGFGMIKTTGTPLEIVHRGISIILPNTGGKWIPAGVVMMVSPYGENVEQVEWDGWAFAGEMDMVNMVPIFGGVTYLTNYMEKFVP
jgi:hypothetical protein